MRLSELIHALQRELASRGDTDLVAARSIVTAPDGQSYCVDAFADVGLAIDDVTYADTYALYIAGFQNWDMPRHGGSFNVSVLVKADGPPACRSRGTELVRLIPPAFSPRRHASQRASCVLYVVTACTGRMSSRCPVIAKSLISRGNPEGCLAASPR